MTARRGRQVLRPMAEVVTLTGLGRGEPSARPRKRRAASGPPKRTPRTVGLSKAERVRRASELLDDLFLATRKKLLKWVPVTGQSAQVDSGYIAQHLVSLVTGIPGIGRRGKGLDLIDTSEVKTANIVDGIDVPRWNVQFVREDTMAALLEHPFIFFVLFDHAADQELRVRIWGGSAIHRL